MIRELLLLSFLGTAQAAFCLTVDESGRGAPKLEGAIAPGSSQLRGVSGQPSQATDQQLLADGMWRDPSTGLTWMRCPLGATFSSDGCQAQARTASSSDQGLFEGHWWDGVQAIQKLSYGGFTDWRIPTVEELAGIFSHCKVPASDGATGRSNPYTPDFTEIKTTRGVFRYQRDCPIWGDHPVPDRQVFLSNSGGQNGVRLWTSTPFGQLLPDAVDSKYGNYHVRNTFWSADASDFRELPVQNGASTPYVTDAGVLAVRGGNYDEFSAMVSSVKDAYSEMAAAGQVIKADEQKYHDQQAALAKDRQERNEAYLKQVDQFRKAVKVGDDAAVNVAIVNDTEIGVVLEIKGDLIKVQTPNPPMTQWYHRNRIYPAAR